MRRMCVAGLAAVALVLAACREADLGTGMNTVTRHYAKPAEEVWKGAVKGVQSADLQVVRDRHDALGGELVACRATGQEVRVTVKAQSERQSRVSVHVAPGDQQLGTMVQERIAQAMGLGEAKAAFFGGNQQELICAVDFAILWDAAECTFDSLDVNTTYEERHATMSKMDGRLRDSVPVRIQLESRDGGKTRIVFTAGNEKNEDNAAFALKMKNQFERCLEKAGAVNP